MPEFVNQATTRGVRVIAQPQYLADQSDPAANRFVWAYTISLYNEGTERVQLLNRYWHITDAQGRVQEVRGPGVIGEQPILLPGQMYQYTSGVPLTTPSGFMHGEYEMRLDSGETFQAVVPAFSLDLPKAAARVN